jgi:hypothetical protein
VNVADPKGMNSSVTDAPAGIRVLGFGVPGLVDCFPMRKPSVRGQISRRWAIMSQTETAMASFPHEADEIHPQSAVEQGVLH